MSTEFEPKKEKRGTARVGARVPISFSLKPGFKHSGALTKDMSECGLRATFDEFIAPQSKLSIRLTLRSNKIMNVAGEVKWSQPMPHSYRYQVGVEFKDIDEASRRSIVEYLAMPK